MHILLLLTISVALLSCQADRATPTSPHTVLASSQDADPFSNYWYGGEAEISTYSLEQARYGEVHQGEAAMIFVSEPFSKSKHVKLDRPKGRDKTDVLKLNMTKKFYTGIYPYSMMLSTFKPIDQAATQPTLKVTCSSQEWCGHTYTQYNLNGNHYDIAQYSYFESEGDTRSKIPAVFMEDEIWTQIRMNPDLLPTGSFKMIPGSMYTRLKHTSFDPVQANAKIKEVMSGLSNYTVTFADGRKLSINFNSSFPNTIESWTESFSSGFGDGKKTLTTTATLKKRIKLDYWNRNGVEDANFRAQLELGAY